MGGHGKNKIEVKKIDDAARSKATYTKRRNGLLKKAYEMSVLCGVDVGFVATSSSDRISQFPSNERFAELIERYINFHDYKKTFSVENQQYLLKLIDCIKRNEIHDFSSVSQQIKDLEQKTIKEKQEIEKIDSKIREFEPNLSKINKISEIDSYSKFLEHHLARIRGIKEDMLGNEVIPMNHENEEDMLGNEVIPMNHENQEINADIEANLNLDDFFFDIIHINRN